MKEDIQDLKNYISFSNKRENFEKEEDWEFHRKTAIKIENLLKAYKEKEIQRNWDMEIISKLSFELGKYQAKSEEDEAVIEEMAKYIRNIGNLDTDEDICKKRIDDCYADIYDACEGCIKEYFRNKVKGEKE